MNLRSIFKKVPSIFLLSGALMTVSLSGAQKPNIIIILADDMGYSDIGCYGGEMATPALDRLANEGVRMTRFHNGGMCVISRKSMLTGKWWPSAQPNFEKTPLLPEKLHDNGYRTALIGKWHLKGDPMDRGFDHFFGFLGGFGDHFSGAKNFRLDREPFTDFGEHFYSSDAFTDRAIEFIESPPEGQEEQPFFLFLSYQAPHNPLQAPKQDILKQRGKYAVGWQAVREARFGRQKELGIVSASAKLPDYPQNLPDWDSLTPEQRDLEDLRMSVYAAMVERLDQGVGRLMDTLAATGKASDTLVLFLSDNGTDPFSKMDAPMLKRGKLPGDPASNFQPGMGWAYASVTPWRLYKISQHSGGVMTGAIARWPGHTGKTGRISDSPVHMVDVMPTLLDMIGQKGEDLKLSGESFLPILEGMEWSRKRPMYFQYMDNRAIRNKQWTLAEVDGSGWELYRTVDDPFETDNRVATTPGVVATLEKRWLQWWREESGKNAYVPRSTETGQHYGPQGDRGSGAPYVPGAMPDKLSKRYPIPKRH